ncbi:hypothetical protein OB03_06260 [Brevundimonas sp. GN22]
MSWYYCLIEGENFPGSLLGKSGLFGFFATHYVQAKSPDEAELEALALLRSDPVLAKGNKQTAPDAKVYFSQIEEVAAPTGPNAGMTWFSMETPLQNSEQA